MSVLKGMDLLPMELWLFLNLVFTTLHSLSPGAWIITGGTATGVMQFVGEAVRDHLITLGSQDKTVVALGIASWGCVANRSALDGEGVRPNF